MRHLDIRGEVERVEEDPELEKYLGKYPNHRPGDERVVVFVRPQHTTPPAGGSPDFNGALVVLRAGEAPGGACK